LGIKTGDNMKAGLRKTDQKWIEEAEKKRWFTTHKRGNSEEEDAEGESIKQGEYGPGYSELKKGTQLTLNQFSWKRIFFTFGTLFSSSVKSTIFKPCMCIIYLPVYK
jgi:hypothetical protein